MPFLPVALQYVQAGTVLHIHIVTDKGSGKKGGESNMPDDYALAAGLS
jgi:hypothetical protein